MAVTFTAITSSKTFGSRWPKRRELAEDAGIADQDIEFFPALEDGGTETVDRRVVLDVGGHKRGRAAKGLYLIVEFFKAALGAGQGDDVGAFLCQGQGNGTAKPARGPGDNSHAVFKLLCHGFSRLRPEARAAAWRIRR